MRDSLKRQALSGLVWQYAERCGAQGIQFVVSLVLARLLMPADYGIVGLITVFISIANVFAQSGLGQALVQRKDADNVDFSTVFYYSIVFAVLLYGVLFVCAPLIAGFYDKQQLILIIRVLGITVIIGAVNSVQKAYVQKTMQFKRFFWATLGGTIASGFVGIFMAYKGLGAWAIVGQQMTNQIIDTIVLWFTVRWRPSLTFSINKMKALFSYGWKLVCSTLLNTVYDNIYSLVIGKVYSPTDLGYYNRADQFPVLIVNNVSSATGSVLFPVLTKVQDQKERFKAMMRRSMVTAAFFIFPCMAGLAAVAKPLTRLLLTDKWLPMVPFVQFSCFIYAFWNIHTTNLAAIKAVGRSDVTLVQQILKILTGFIILIVTVRFGLYVMMIGRCVSTIISLFINAYPNKKLINYSYSEQLKDLFPSFALSLGMAVIVLLFGQLPLHPLLMMVIQVIAGAVVYFAGAKLFKFECLDYAINTIKELKKGCAKA